MATLKNARHEHFAQWIAKGKSADESYRLAGFKPGRGNATRLKLKDSIKTRVAELVGRGADRAEIDIARTLAELVRVGTSDVRKLFDADGNLIPITELDDETAAAIAAVEVVARQSGQSEELESQPQGGKLKRRRAETEYVHKVKFWDKNSALEKIARHLGMFVEKVELTGRDGGPIETRDASPRDEIARRITGIASRTAANSNSKGPERRTG